jgi:hypothetical protein
MDLSQGSESEVGKGKKRKLSVVKEPIQASGYHNRRKRAT